MNSSKEGAHAGLKHIPSHDSMTLYLVLRRMLEVLIMI